MTSTLLLPLDGSDKDHWALPVGCAFAELAQADVHIVRVVEPLEEWKRRYVARLLRKAAERISIPGGRRASYELLDGADVAHAVLEVANARDASLVVMATRAASGIDRAVRGSVADRLVRESERPIVVAPPGASALRYKQPRLRRALIPVDGSSAALHVISHLVALPGAHGLELVLFQVVEPEPTGGYAMPEPMPTRAELMTKAMRDQKVEWVHVNAERAEERLNEVADGLRRRVSGVEVRVIEGKDPATAILDATREMRADFIAMTTRGAGGVRRMVLGSVAEHVVRESEVPVLLVTPDR